MYLYKLFNSFYLLVFIYTSFLITGTVSEYDITINIAPGSEECFYESLKIGQVIDIDYQVIDGGQGAFDISFYLTSPAGRTVVMDYKKAEKSHRIEVDEEGDYQLCFDNKFSSFTAKTVYFELIIEAEDGTDVDMWEDFGKSAPYNLQDIQESVNKVKSHLLKIRHFQETFRAFEARDKNILEGNYARVNSWSIVQIIVMIFVGVTQVIMVRSLFDEQSKVHKIWKKTLS